MSINPRGIVAIIGQGYVGLPLAMTLVQANWKVIGLDLDEHKIDLLKSGLSPIEDVSHSVIAASINGKNYLPTTEVNDISTAQIIIICVPTPLDDSHKPDLSILRSALQSVAPYIQSESLIISESTSFPGTLRDVVVKEVSSPQTIVVKVYHNFDESVGNERRIFNLTQTPPAGGLIWGSGLWGENWSTGAISSTILTGSNLGLAKCIQLEFNGPSGQQWGINSIGYKYQARKVKG